MSDSYPTFDRLKVRGLAVYKAGNYAEGKLFLMQAAVALCATIAARHGKDGATETNP